MPKNTSTTEPSRRRKAALEQAGREVLPGNKHGGDPPQSRIDGENAAEKAWEEYKDLAGDYAMKAQAWSDAQELRDVRLDDLVKVHNHRPMDDEAAARVSQETARAVEACKKALEDKQAAKKALDAAWATVRDLEGEKTVRPLIPDEPAGE